MISPCIMVPRKQGEDIRQELLKEGILRRDLKIRTDKQFIFLPLKKRISWGGYPLKLMDFSKINKISFREIVKASIPEDLIPTSFDIIGDLGVIKISDEQKKYKTEIGEALLQAHKHLKVILMDEGVHQDFRLRQVQWIAGEKRTETIHREYGINLWLDITKTYYSPRLSSERYRIARQIQKGAIVIDMFAGVAPFSILIGKIAEPKKIYAIDINPDATYYAQKNVRENNQEKTIEIITGDAQKILPLLDIVADHLIMNLPHSSDRYFSDALPYGKMIHYYSILDKEMLDSHLHTLEGSAHEKGYSITILETRTIGTYSPEKIKIGMDIKVKKK